MIVVAAFGLRIAYVAATPDYRTVHDARDYDRHAISVARGEGFSEEITGKPTAFRPPGYVYLLGGVYARSASRTQRGPRAVARSPAGSAR